MEANDRDSEELKMWHRERIAWRKAGRIPGWKTCMWEVVDIHAKARDFIMEGGIPRLLKTGKRKGHETWQGSKLTRVIVADAEIRAEELAYTKLTGNCSRCMGKGEVFSSWCAVNGVETKTCNSCGGTGKHAEAA